MRSAAHLTATRHLQVLLALATVAALAAALAGASAPARAAAGPPNDEIANATAVRALPYEEAVDLSGAAPTDPGDPTVCFPAHHTVWYRFTPARATDVLADTAGSDFDTTLAVFTGRPRDLSLVVCNDDARGTAQSRVLFRARAGVTYWVMVGSYYEGFAGVAQLHMRAVPPALRLDVSVYATGSVTRAGAAIVRGSVSCSRPADVTLIGSVRQGRSLGYFSLALRCDRRVSWAGRTRGETGGFRPGPATATATASHFDVAREELVRDYAERRVELSTR